MTHFQPNPLQPLQLHQDGDPMSSRHDTSTPTADVGDKFDPLVALDDLLGDVGLSRAETGGRVSLTGHDPIVPAAHRLGACIGVPIMAGAVAAVAFHRQRGGPAQDLELDLRQAVHSINPGAFWSPTLNGERAPHPLLVDNPFLIVPYPTSDNRWIMASGVLPHLAAKWCRFLDVPPDADRVAEAIVEWNAFELEEAASAAGLPACVVRSPSEWLAHEQGALLAAQPVVGLERVGDAPVRDFAAAERPFEGVRVLSLPTPSPARPSEGLWPSTGQTCSVAPAPTTTSTSSSMPKPMWARAVPTSTSILRLARSGPLGYSPTPMSWSTTIAAARSNAMDSTPDNWRNAIRVSYLCQSPVTDRADHGHSEAAST
jgi:hypothetical protein